MFYLKRNHKFSRRCSSLLKERRTGTVGNEKVQELAEFVSKMASKRRREVDYELFTETLGILVQDAYELEAFQTYCLDMFVGLGWRTSRGYFSRTFSYDEIQDLNTELITSGFASKIMPKKRRNSHRCRSRGRSRRKALSPCRFPKIQDHLISKQRTDGEFSEDDIDISEVSSHEENLTDNDDRIPRAWHSNRHSKRSKRYVYEAEEDVKDDTHYFNVKMFDESLGFGIGQHRWSGVEVTWVKSNCEAWSCGIRRGDVLVAINHVDIRYVESLSYVCELLEEARPLSLRVKRERSRSP